MSEMSYIIDATGVPCAQYEGGEGDERLRETFAFALGLIGTPKIIHDIRLYVARLYDHKGVLIVLTRQPLPPSWRMSFRRAWEECAYEEANDVHFVPVGSYWWESIWEGRRFESDWRAPPLIKEHDEEMGPATNYSPPST